jgi:hypothetical protein
MQDVIPPIEPDKGVQAEPKRATAIFEHLCDYGTPDGKQTFRIEDAKELADRIAVRDYWCIGL